MRYKIKILAIVLGCLAILSYPSYKLVRHTHTYKYLRHTIFPKIDYQKSYAIGIFEGPSPTSLGPAKDVTNPVLTAADVSDVPADFVADPFMIQQGDTKYLFFEVLNAKSKRGEIGLATSDDWFNWKYEQIVLSETFHLSYPYVFKWENDYYMIPESESASEIRLYKADDFPKKWSYVKTLIKGKYGDPSIVYYQQKFWLFASEGHDDLYVFFADDLRGPWQPHPKNPIIDDNPHIARPGGRMLVLDGKLIRFTQDDFPRYGLKVHAFEITELSPTTYQEKLIADSVLQPSGSGWNASGMHHVDPHQISETHWIACVDGWSMIAKGFKK